MSLTWLCSLESMCCPPGAFAHVTRHRLLVGEPLHRGNLTAAALGSHKGYAISRCTVWAAIDRHAVTVDDALVCMQCVCAEQEISAQVSKSSQTLVVVDRVPILRLSTSSPTKDIGRLLASLKSLLLCLIFFVNFGKFSFKYESLIAHHAAPEVRRWR